VTSCMETKEGYSATCAACFGTLAQCTADNCMLKCAGGRTADCVSCLKAAGCDSAWDTCTGWTAPSATSVSSKSDACSDADTAIYGTPGSGGGYDNFESDMTSCGTQCLGKADCVTSCMETKEGYSATCAACFGTLAQCTADNCMLKCAGGRTADCVSCLKAAGCDSAWDTCTGWTAPSASSIHVSFPVVV